MEAEVQRKTKITGIFNLLFGPSNNYSLEHRFLNGSLILGAITALSSLLFNIMLQLGIYLISLTGLTILIFGVLYYFTRVRNEFHVPLYILSGVVLILLSLLWLANAGSNGPIIYIYFAILAFFIFVHQGAGRIIMVCLLILNIVALSLIEIWMPQWITPYTDPSIRTIDHFSVLIPTILIIYFVVSYARLNLLEEKKKAEKSDQLKSAFLANMSHEIRTPMNSILGFSQLLEDENIAKESRKQYLGYIHSSGKSLLNLINDIIDISKIEAGEMKINKSYFNLYDIMQELYVTFDAEKAKLDKSHIKLNLELPIFADSYQYYTDPLRLKQILMNLLTNAFKYTDEGSVTFGFREKQKELIFFVRDTGIGMTEEHMKKIFERFWKIEDHTDRLYSGTGLGLAISKHLTELLGGKIDMESKKDIGSEFLFTLPLKKKNMEDPSKTPREKQKSYNWKDRVILIVEDDPSNYTYLNEVLIPTQAELIWAKDGREAIERFREFRVSLVLMDIKLPVMDGIDALQSIKQINRKLPVIAITAYAMSGEKEKYMLMGFDGYYSKPVNSRELIEGLAVFLSE